MKSIAKFLASGLLATLTTACGTVYKFTPEPGGASLPTADEVAITQRGDDFTVTVGPLMPYINGAPLIGILIVNDSARNLDTMDDAAQVSINGRRIAVKTLQNLRKENAAIRTGDAFATGIAAGSRTLQQSNSGVALAPNRPANLPEAVLRGSQQAGQSADAAATQIARVEAARIQNRQASAAWDQTRDLRYTLAVNRPQMEQFYWRNETISGGDRVFRTVVVDGNPTGGLAGQNGRMTVEIRIAESTFSYEFRVTPSSSSEAIGALRTYFGRY